MIKKPMLAESVEDISALRFPIACTPKLDGIRCLVIGGKVLSRSFKEIPNGYVQKMMKQCPDGLDGELMVKGNFNDVQSAIMREEGEPDFEFWVFDYVDSTGISTPYSKRMENLAALSLPAFCKKVIPWAANNPEELKNFEQMVLSQGYEGVMLRSFTSPYKCGRSSLKEGYLLKLKIFLDSEAEVIGFEEQMSNQNEKTKDEFGNSKRSSHKANMVPANTLGKFLVREVGNTPWKGKEFAIGTGEGLTHELRKSIWDNKEDHLGKVITYKYQPHGVKDLPRLPIWKGFRDKRDMS